MNMNAMNEGPQARSFQTLPIGIFDGVNIN